MFTFKKKDHVLELLEQAIEDTCKEMASINSDSDEYAKQNKQLSELIVTRSKVKNESKISPETWAVIIANLAGIVLIMNHERMHALTSKAVGTLIKPRI